MLNRLSKVANGSLGLVVRVGSWDADLGEEPEGLGDKIGAGMLLLEPAGLGEEVKVEPAKVWKARSPLSDRSCVLDKESVYFLSMSDRVSEYRLFPYR